MTYLQKNNEKRKILPIIIGFIIILIAIINVVNISPLRKPLTNISSPIFKFGDVVSRPFNGVFGYFKFKRDLEEDNYNLRLEIGRLESEIRILKTLEEENENLKEQFGRNTDEDKGILGTILKRPPFSPYDTFVIDLGKDRINIGQKVYVNRVLIGEIIEVNNHTSIIRLFSSSNVKMRVFLNNKIEVEAIGKGGGRFEALIPRDVDIKIGDPVIVSELKPKLFAVIESIEDDMTNTLKIVKFNIPFSLQTIQYVEVK